MTPNPHRALSRIDELIQTMDDPRAAYVVRSRLDRTMLVLHQHIQDIRELHPSIASQLLELAKRVEDAFLALRRRSEPFGEAWISKLGSTRIELDRLRSILASE